MKNFKIENQLFVIIESNEKVSSAIKLYAPPQGVDSVIFDTMLVKGIGTYRFIKIPVRNGKLALKEKKYTKIEKNIERMINKYIFKDNNLKKYSLTSYEKDLLKSS